MSTRRWFGTAGLVVLTGALGACAAGGPTAPATGGDQQETGRGVSVGEREIGTANSDGRPGAVDGSTAPAPATSPLPPVLTGKRWGTIVRTGSFEGGVSLLDGGRLAEVDGDEGRQLFAPTPIGGNKYLVKAYNRGSATPLCWVARNPGDGRPLIVEGAACNAQDRHQQFDIAPVTRDGKQVYLFSNSSAYLRHSARNGLILEESGDAPPVSDFRINDNGPAPTG
ncbi:hypothetical protein ABT336_01175 [Micromonospora sp. NPDC000207]|uniref:hypothetical protein n=1 Tax=Micromonospora sp. NPDC000207 TaxID=3154246 RepID=UPI00331A4D51